MKRGWSGTPESRPPTSFLLLTTTSFFSFFKTSHFWQESHGFCRNHLHLHRNVSHMSTTLTGLLIYSSILTQQWVLHNNQDWWSIITSERSSLIFCTTVKSNFLKTSRRPLLNRREWNLFGKTRQTLRALKCGESNKQARLHEFTYSSVCLYYMCLNVRCACVTCIYTLCVFVLHMFTHTRALLLNRTPGDNWWGEQNFWFEAARSLFPPPWHESFAGGVFARTMAAAPFCRARIAQDHRDMQLHRHLGINYFKGTCAPDVFCNPVEQQWSNLGLMKKVSIVLERKQICLLFWELKSHK